MFSQACSTTESAKQQSGFPAFKETTRMNPPTVFALDFDGVLCDSAAETCAAAWRAGRALWPGWEAPEPPPEFTARFRELRPVLETGYQAIALLRLVEEEFTAPLSQLSTVTPVSFAESAERIFAATGLGRADLVRLFGDARDQWIAADPEGWLARHEFYPGVAEALNAAAARGCPLFVLTTKQHRFTERLLQNAGVGLPADRIFGLETGRPKEEILKGLAARPDCCGLRMVFVEDRLEALERAAAVPELAGVELRFATWGYCENAEGRRQKAEQNVISPPHRHTATPSHRFQPWTLPEFTAALRG
jgi:phosphoglycolate phosphatase-like HAD superfamily hydrolase